MTLFVEPRQSPTSGGNNYASAKYTFYLTGTTTPATVYTDAARTTPHASPVVADSGGVFAPIWLDPLLTYRRVLQTAAGATLSDVDPYPGVGLTETELWNLLPFSDQTAAEISAGAAVVNTEYPPCNILRYADNTTPGTTNMGAALQKAINVAALSGYGDVIVPRGLYSIQGDIYFHYDATSNAVFPSTAGSWGMVNIVGEGWQDYTAYSNGVNQGSILDIGANQFKIGKGVQGTRGVRFKNCTVRGNSTTYLIKYYFASRGCGFEDFTLFQAGVGGGIEMNDTFLVSLENVFAQSTNGATTGTGFYIHNSTQAAGLYDLRQVSAVSFAKNFVIGEEGTSASSMNGINMENCQGKDGQYNLIMGNGVKSCVVDTFHNEGPTTIGVVTAYGASHTRFEGMYSSTAGTSADYMSLGLNTGTDATDYCRDISVLNSIFTGIKDNRTAINVYTSSSAIDREIAYCQFTGTGVGDTAIKLENAAQHGLKIGPNRYTTVATEVSNATLVDSLKTGDTLGLTTYYAPIAFRATNQQFVAGVVTFTNADATPTVAGGDVFITTGTTAITDFDDGVLGQTIRIQATGNITITHNAAIIKLSAAGNFAMTADDTLTLTMFVDQIWQEVSRTVI